MGISIDITALTDLGIKNPFVFTWWIFIHGGWIVVAVLFLVALFLLHLDNAQGKYAMSIKYVLLAIDIPKENEQSLKAVEQIFAQMSTIVTKINLYAKYWKGKLQPSFSLELVSIGGYIQYLIRTPEKYRDIIEAAVYSQYPDAEITEVEDYTKTVPNDFPNKEYNLWGTELILIKDEVYPIRTYASFEHSLTQTFADPMASILEGMSRLHEGEQVWIQMVLSPGGSDWAKRGENVVKKLIGAKIAEKKNLVSPITDSVKGFGSEALRQLASIGAGEEKKKKDEPYSNLLALSPVDRIMVDAITEKISKIGFRVKMRFIYAAKKEFFVKARGVNPTMGGIRQFNTLNLNALKSHSKIETDDIDYLFVKKREAWRQRKIIRAYKYRSNWRGWGLGFILNIEELASIYHFPILTITTPIVKKTEMKKGGPPAALPIETPVAPFEKTDEVKEPPPLQKPPPENLSEEEDIYYD